MWIDGRDIPENQLQSYIDRQRQISRGIGAESMANVMTELLVKSAKENEELRKQISNLKRQLTKTKNRLEIPWIPCKERYPSSGEKVVAYLPTLHTWKILRYIESGWSTGYSGYSKQEVTHWVPVECLPVKTPRKR